MALRCGLQLAFLLMATSTPPLRSSRAAGDPVQAGLRGGVARPSAVVTGARKRRISSPLSVDRVAPLRAAGRLGRQVPHARAVGGEHVPLASRIMAPTTSEPSLDAGGERAFEELGEQGLVFGEHAVFGVVGQVVRDVVPALDHLVAQHPAAAHVGVDGGDHAHHQCHPRHQGQHLRADRQGLQGRPPLSTACTLSARALLGGAPTSTCPPAARRHARARLGGARSSTPPATGCRGASQHQAPRQRHDQGAGVAAGGHAGASPGPSRSSAARTFCRSTRMIRRCSSLATPRM